MLSMKYTISYFFCIRQSIVAFLMRFCYHFLENVQRFVEAKKVHKFLLFKWSDLKLGRSKCDWRWFLMFCVLLVRTQEISSDIRSQVWRTVLQTLFLMSCIKATLNILADPSFLFNWYYYIFFWRGKSGNGGHETKKTIIATIMTLATIYSVFLTKQRCLKRSVPDYSTTICRFRLVYFLLLEALW